MSGRKILPSLACLHLPARFVQADGIRILHHVDPRDQSARSLVAPLQPCPALCQVDDDVESQRGVCLATLARGWEIELHRICHCDALIVEHMTATHNAEVSVWQFSL